MFDICALQNSDPSDVIYTSGCIEQGEVWVNHNLIPVAGVFVGLALVQVWNISEHWEHEHTHDCF